MPDILKIDKDLAVGFARVCITDGWKHPRTGCEFPEYTVHDDLWATALVVCTGATPVAALVSLDLGTIRTPAATELRILVSRKTGIAAERVALHCTHTHASYDANVVEPEVFSVYIADAITEAAASAKPASVAHGHRELGVGYNFNRRIHLSDGLGAHCVMFNDDCRTEGGRVEGSGQLRKVVRGWEADWDNLEMSRRENWTDGPIDPHLHVLQFREAAGKTLGTVVRFAGHPVIVSRHWIGNVLSRDAVGYVSDYFTHVTHAPCLYLTGPSGNQRLYCEEYTHGEARLRGQAIAEEALKTGVDFHPEPFERFVLAADEVELNLWHGFPRTREEQQKKLAALEAEVKSAVAERRSPADIKNFAEAHTRMNHAGGMLDRRVLTPDEAADGKFNQPISVFDFGAASIVTFACEPFMEVSRGVREKAGENVIPIQLTNGAHGYVPTAEEWALGGYETTWCSTAPGAADRYIAAACDLLDAARM
ncbi:MAG TPA: hypothetical protein VMZ92_14810 [Planctomycetota bacterium]|nr:hypothetical protein [Planctomycetota bacterium]